MLQFDPTDPEELAFTLNKAVKQSGLQKNASVATSVATSK